MIQTKNILKTYFETGDYPTQKQFEVLIDSMRHVNDGATVTSVKLEDDGGVTFYFSTDESVTIKRNNLPDGFTDRLIEDLDIENGYVKLKNKNGDIITQVSVNHFANKISESEFFKKAVQKLIPNSQPIAYILGLQQALNNMATVAQLNEAIAMLAYGIKYSWDTAVQRNAQTGMKKDEQGIQKDTREVYKYTGSSWELFYTLDAVHNHDDRYYTKSGSDAKFITQQRAVSDALTSTSSVTAASSKALKTVNDKVNNKLDKTAKAADSDKLDGKDSSYFLALTNIVDNLSSTATNKPLSAKQGKVLKQLIDNINTILTSDDTSLDEIQEIVNYIKQNKEELQNLGISNIAGLQAALNGKESKFSKNTAFNKHFGTTSGTVAQGNHTHSWKQIKDIPATFPAISHNHDGRYYTETESNARFLGKTAKAADSNKLDGLNSTSFFRDNVNNIGNWQLASKSKHSGYAAAALEIRELNFAGKQEGANTEAPRISFHWGSRVASQIMLRPDGDIAVMNNTGTAYEHFRAAKIYSNDALVATQNWTDETFLGKTAKATDSNKLDGINSSQFLRSDVADTVSETLTFTKSIKAEALSGLKTAPIVVNNTTRTTNGINTYIPTIHSKTITESGFRQHLSIGHKRKASWDEIYIAVGGNDNYPTKEWLFDVVKGYFKSPGDIFEAGTTLSSKYLGKTAKATDSNKLDGLDSSAFLRSDANDSFSGKLVHGSKDTQRDAGIYGVYNSKKIGHIWSISTTHKIHPEGTDFGNLYGLAYKHTNNTTGGTMAGGHQAVWCEKGVPKAAMGGDGLWSAEKITALGNVTANEFYATGGFYYGNNKKMLQFSDAWLRLNPANQFTGGIYCAKSTLRTDNQLQVGSGGSAFFANSAGDGKFNRNLTVNGNIYGKSVKGAYSHLYRFGGIHFTWESGTYGTNAQHSIKSTYGTKFGDSLTMNSYNNIRLNIDSNNNNSDSKFEIGHNTTGTANVLFSVDESGNTTASGNVCAYSDRRLKTNVNPLKENILNKINQLKPSFYKWKNTTKNQGQQLGFIAQDVKEIFPEWVQKSGEYYAMNYDKMGAVLAVKGIQELNKENESLKIELNQLKQQMQEIKQLLKQ